jgi:large subunit ribosomal protein L10
MPNLINEIIVRKLSDEFARAEGMVIVSLAGLSVRETEDLRTALAERGVRLRMVRNRLARLALKSRGLEAGEELFGGNVACAWGSSEDAIKIAKVVANAVRSADPKKKARLGFRGGFFEGRLLDAKAAAALADLPGKEELRARLLGLISGPARSLATLLQAPCASLARVLDAHASKAGTSPGASGGTESSPAT